MTQGNPLADAGHTRIGFRHHASHGCPVAISCDGYPDR
jgi:hypothetical protein